MGAKFKNEAADRELLDEGSYNAICVAFDDLGTQKNEKFGTESRQCSMTFEIQDEQTSEGEPFYVYKRYNLKFSPKATLAKDLKSWRGLEIGRGDEFDTDDVVGVPALITLENNETEKGTFTNITSVAAPLKNAKFRKPKSELRVFSLDTDTLDTEVFDTLSPYLQTLISSSKEYAALIARGRSKKQPSAVARGAEKATAKSNTNGKATSKVAATAKRR